MQVNLPKETFIGKNTLVGRTSPTCDKYNINFINFDLNDKYNIICMLKQNPYLTFPNGYLDSLRTLLSDFDNNNRCLVHNYDA